ncbi:MAG: FAD-dependent oxidoreductase, partial [Methanotrichaceae archaeon]
MSDNSRLKVVVIGGGIAGAELIRRALPGPYDITLIEPKNQIECQALYPEYIACNASLEDLVAPLKPFCDRVGAELINERAVRLEGNRVICDKSTVEYDLAVIATGAVQNYFGIHGSDKAFSVNTFSGAMRARDYLERKSPEKIVIIGSGLTGVETACALSDSLNADISVVETKNRLLPQFSENVSSIIEKTLFGKGVKTFVSMRVQEICEDSILFSDGQSLECDIAIWTGGIKP